jgi:Domain of unknown function (DUF4349)
MTSHIRDRGVHPSAPYFLVVGLLVALVAGCATAAAPATGSRDDGGIAGAPPTSAPQPAEPGTGGSDALAPRDGAKIVRTGTVTLQVDDVPAAITAARALVDGVGGYVGASRQALRDERPVAQITYRIPAERWDEAVVALRDLGTVIDEQTDSLEVTGQLVDLAARIENLRASERSLQAIASSATRIADVLEVQERLFQVRGEIEQLAAQQAHLEDQAAYGTLTVSFGVEVVAIAEVSRNWSAETEVDRATASLVNLLQGVATAAIWFAIVLLPVLVAIGAVALAVGMTLRRMGVRARGSATPPAATAG